MFAATSVASSRPGPETAAGDEEFAARLHVAAHPQAERDLEEGVGEQQTEVKVQGPAEVTEPAAKTRSGYCRDLNARPATVLTSFEGSTGLVR